MKAYNKHMNRKGELVFGTIILMAILLSSAVAYTSYEIVNENRYVGDKTNMDMLVYYDLKTCKINHIDKNNLLPFESKEDAIKNGYKPAPCVKE